MSKKMLMYRASWKKETHGREIDYTALVKHVGFEGEFHKLLEERRIKVELLEKPVTEKGFESEYNEGFQIFLLPKCLTQIHHAIDNFESVDKKMKCPECSGEVSYDDSSCCNCGYRIN